MRRRVFFNILIFYPGMLRFPPVHFAQFEVFGEVRPAESPRKRKNARAQERGADLGLDQKWRAFGLIYFAPKVRHAGV